MIGLYVFLGIVMLILVASGIYMIYAVIYALIEYKREQKELDE